jgi:hypothetical protein
MVPSGFPASVCIVFLGWGLIKERTARATTLKRAEDNGEPTD